MDGWYYKGIIFFWNGLKIVYLCKAIHIYLSTFIKQERSNFQQFFALKSMYFKAVEGKKTERTYGT